MRVSLAVQAGKRPLIPKTPQPAKKAKADVKEPKSAPAKMQKGASSVLFPGPNHSGLRVTQPQAVKSIET